MKLTSPKFNVIEQTALKFAMTYYETARSQGLKPRNPKHKTGRLWALSNFQLFIPHAIDTLLEMLNGNAINEHMKQDIYDAILERTNDPHVNAVFPKAGVLPELDLKKMLENAPNKPVVIKTDAFDKKQRPIRERLKNSIVTEDNKYG